MNSTPNPFSLEEKGSIESSSLLIDLPAILTFGWKAGRDLG
jgi:hypothetical protein